MYSFKTYKKKIFFSFHLWLILFRLVNTAFLSKFLCHISLINLLYKRDKILINCYKLYLFYKTRSKLSKEKICFDMLYDFGYILLRKLRILFVKKIMQQNMVFILFTYKNSAYWKIFYMRVYILFPKAVNDLIIVNYLEAIV